MSHIEQPTIFSSGPFLSGCLATILGLVGTLREDSKWSKEQQGALPVSGGHAEAGSPLASSFSPGSEEPRRPEGSSRFFPNRRQREDLTHSQPASIPGTVSDSAFYFLIFLFPLGVQPALFLAVDTNRGGLSCSRWF